MAAKPELPAGYLGPQEKFTEFGLSTLSHSGPEIVAQDNQLEIKLKMTKPVKVTCELIACSNEKETTQFTFTQTLDKTISFIVHFPESGYYKLQIYALPVSDESKTLPGVYNYLVQVKRALNAAYPFPKQYAQWKEGCFLSEPLVLHPGSRLSNVTFKCIIPEAKGVAVVVEGEWVHLEKNSGNNWIGKLPLDKFRNKGVKVILCGNFGPDETKYTNLLEYSL